MDKIEIDVYTKLNNKEETNHFLAIKDNNVIKYNDLEDNKMVIDFKKKIITRENIDYRFNMDFPNNTITITLKSMNKNFYKDIKTFKYNVTEHYIDVVYLLLDENIINEYYVKF